MFNPNLGGLLQDVLKEHICSCRKSILKYQDPLNFVDVCTFLQNVIMCSQKWYLFKKCWRFSAEQSVKDFFVLVLVFVRRKVVINKNLKNMNQISRILLLDCTVLTENWKNGITFPQYVIINYFCRRHIFLFKLWQWSKFYFSIITDSEVVTIFSSDIWQEIWKFQRTLCLNIAWYPGNEKS